MRSGRLSTGNLAGGLLETRRAGGYTTRVVHSPRMTCADAASLPIDVSSCACAAVAGVVGGSVVPSVTRGVSLGRVGRTGWAAKFPRVRHHGNGLPESANGPRLRLPMPARIAAFRTVLLCRETIRRRQVRLLHRAIAHCNAGNTGRVQSQTPRSAEFVHEANPRPAAGVPRRLPVQ